jgi:hypothetical protein
LGAETDSREAVVVSKKQKQAADFKENGHGVTPTAPWISVTRFRDFPRLALVVYLGVK